MASSDKEIISNARGRLDARNVSKLPDKVLEQHLEEAKDEISREVAEQLTVRNLSFNEIEDLRSAVEDYTVLKAESDRKGQVVPAGIGRLMRQEFDDENQRYRRDQIVRKIDGAFE